MLIVPGDAQVTIELVVLLFLGLFVIILSFCFSTVLDPWIETRERERERGFIRGLRG